MISPPPSRSRHIKGFTLAEVLIALVIIGIIAAITISSLIQSTQKQEFVSKLQKTYSVLSQVTNQIIAEEGSPKGNDSWMQNLDDLYDMYKKHLNNAKECGSVTGCFAYSVKQFSGKVIDNEYGASKNRKLILNDGTQISFNYWKFTNACDGNYCAEIVVDINGEKLPNVIGRDIFMFYLKESGLYPAGCDSYKCPTGGGYTCACKVLREGVMNY